MISATSVGRFLAPTLLQTFLEIDAGRSRVTLPPKLMREMQAQRESVWLPLGVGWAVRCRSKAAAERGPRSLAPDLPAGPRLGRETEPSGAPKLVDSLFRSERLRQFIKFCAVGASGTVVDMTALFLLADPKTLGLNVTLSKVCAAETALINNFVWNELWTFKPALSFPASVGRASPRAGSWAGPSAPGRLSRFLRFNGICGAGIVFAVLLLHFFHTLLGWNLYLSNLLAIGLVTLWNFGMNAQFNWCGSAAKVAS